MEDHSNHEGKVIFIRNFIFGVEDSLVSTVGLLSGIAWAGVARETVFLTGVVLVLVEAFSMAVGSFLTEHSAEEYIHGTAVPSRMPIWGGMIMFISYFISGFIPLSPYIFLSIPQAFPLSIILSLLSLFILGVLGARFARTSWVKSGLRMFLVGGAAIFVGVLAGNLAG
ncbi:MAG: hypothetical protein G01um101418_793 [Parcubacteria group bacterium Gr01-1014_18]|nr:MAG: hypothetical protein Greene041636_675 [Parcubacteria group bacterium Greene0416_36]TSC80095.1 MAG: hypothetical protein G01um101418_793 [Parcubacteria group bacterium Gr01-1014_18]TSC98615.1 MAG: hypothetical protein Greene101420_667 [Parcubacteria group bacterium Greene1014_20]TSD06442.1 MAG: hypothetical protein Greene07142_933 [Parcubacteria group bacterium Greene0714_2]